MIEGKIIMSQSYWSDAAGVTSYNDLRDVINQTSVNDVMKRATNPLDLIILILV